MFAEYRALVFEPSQEIKSQLYGLYKQITVGCIDVTPKQKLAEMSPIMIANRKAWWDVRNYPIDKAVEKYKSIFDEVREKQIEILQKYYNQNNLKEDGYI